MSLARVLPTGNPAAAALYCVAPECLLGWPTAPPETRPPTRPSLPEVARLNPYDLAASAAVVRATKADLVLDFGTATAASEVFAEALEAETGVAVAMIDGRLGRSGESLRALGRRLGAPARGEALANAYQRLWERVGRTLPATGGPRVHYAIGPHGDKTVRRNSIHLDAITMTGGELVAPVECGAGGRVSIAPEAVAAADPDLILTIDPDFHAVAATLEVWADMAAVRAGRVYLAPAPVLSWLDYPPAPNRIIGLAWLARLFHGADIDVAAEAVAFHALFYGRQLDAAVLAETLLHAGIRPA